MCVCVCVCVCVCARASKSDRTSESHMQTINESINKKAACIVHSCMEFSLRSPNCFCPPLKPFKKSTHTHTCSHSQARILTHHALLYACLTFCLSFLLPV
mmetsp:Transcript_35801/g.70505  ORF Transcript_35801/g.70505 Transcript_35801/m.70505 type:complete len:100 (+) Transcript_35801:3-302(+)